MPTRPLSITFVSVFLMIVGAATGISIPLSMRNPELVSIMQANALPVAVQFAMMGMAALVNLVSGFLMLKGKVMGRLVYIAWTVFSFVMGLLTSQALLTLMPGLVVFLIILFFLFRPAANRFFAGEKVA